MCVSPFSMDAVYRLRATPDAIILAPGMDSAGSRKVLRWLLVSLLAHAALVAWYQMQPAAPVVTAPIPRASLELTLSRPPAPPNAMEELSPEALPRPNVGAPLTAPKSAPAIEPAPLEQQPRAPGLRLDLSLPELGTPDPGAATENGAIVMNPELLDVLRAAPRRSGVEARVERDPSGEFQAGAWVEYYRDGDACFRVQRANALAAFDYDVWYRVACP